MRIVVAALLLVPSLAFAKDKPLPGAQRQPPLFIDEAGSALRLLSADEGYRIKAYVEVSGGSSGTDQLTIEWKQKGKLLATAECDERFDVPSKWVRAECTSGPNPITAKGAIDAELIYWDDQAEKEYLVRTFKVNVKTWKEASGSTLWQIVPDDLLGAAWVVHGGYQYPLIRFWASVDNGEGVGALRCAVDGKKLEDVKAVLSPVTRNDPIEADHIPAKGDRQRYRWIHLELRPELRYGEKNLNTSAVLVFLIENPGKWDCQLRLDRRAVRQFLFTVDDKGFIVQNEIQSGKNPIPTLPGVVLIDVRIPGDTGYDTRLRPDAMKKSMGFGLPWPDHPNVKLIHAAFPPASGLPDPR